MKLMTRKINVQKLFVPAVALSTALTITWGLTGCGSSFQTASAPGCVGNCNGNNSSSGHPPAGGGTVITPPTDTEWKNLNMNGQLGSGRFAFKQVVTIDKTTKELVLSLPMPANPYIDGMIIDVPLTKLPGAHARLEALEGGGSALVLRVPLSYLLKGVDFLPASRLPNGDPLPAIPDGEMPSMAIQLAKNKNINATFYLAVDTLGIYVNSPFNPLIYISVPIKSDDGRRTWGYLTSIPAKGEHDGGFFISVQIPDDIARIIDNNL